MAYTKEQRAVWRKERHRKTRELIDMAKNVPCRDCGVVYPPYVMDFDHVRGSKMFNIGQSISKTAPIDSIINEISKCEVVCSNCHRIRTHQRNNR